MQTKNNGKIIGDTSIGRLQTKISDKEINRLLVPSLFQSLHSGGWKLPFAFDDESNNDNDDDNHKHQYFAFARASSLLLAYIATFVLLAVSTSDSQ